MEAYARSTRPLPGQEKSKNPRLRDEDDITGDSELLDPELALLEEEAEKERESKQASSLSSMDPKEVHLAFGSNGEPIRVAMRRAALSAALLPPSTLFNAAHRSWLLGKRPTPTM